ncbi:hypothetical protein HYC85_013376 [Camellia sinensis]|uniref:Uncharacterized protein n=1 Tax=Camellia sinensis TaxID=4442 RepID=A0A7J7H385_CAMSI|nr:hypothetical protein HYC85_013376 [Camellia sinensis]
MLTLDDMFGNTVTSNAFEMYMGLVEPSCLLLSASCALFPFDVPLFTYKSVSLCASCALYDFCIVSVFCPIIFPTSSD